MVKRSTKSKSKRTPLRQKYKIIRKVKEHHKKKAKEAKKQAKKVKASGQAPSKRVKPSLLHCSAKDFGVPNEWPFRAEELKLMEERRERAKLEIETKKREKKERAAKRRAGLLEAPELTPEDDAMDAFDVGASEDGGEALRDLTKEAETRASEFERIAGGKMSEKGSGTMSKIDPDNSLRAFHRELNKVFEVADVIIEVLDARDPNGCRCLWLERAAVKRGKRVVLLLNKIDLVPKEVTHQWLLHLRSSFPCVAFKSNTQKGQRENLSQGGRRRGRGREGGGGKRRKGGEAEGEGETGGGTGGSECLGADSLIQLLKNYARNQKLKTSVTVGVIGYPNVGKSSLINSLKRAKAANVGATPGITRSVQEIHLDKHLKLLDSPGIVFTSSRREEKEGEGGGEVAAVLRNAVKVEKIKDVISPVAEILRLCPAHVLMSIFRIPTFADVDELLILIGRAKGRVKKGGVVDKEECARIVLREWNSGKIPFYTLPPKKDNASAVKGEGEGEGERESQEGDYLPTLVSDWSKEFDFESIEKAQVTTLLSSSLLPSLGEGGREFVCVPSAALVNREGEGEEAMLMSNETYDDKMQGEEEDNEGDENGIGEEEEEEEKEEDEEEADAMDADDSIMGEDDGEENEEKEEKVSGRVGGRGRGKMEGALSIAGERRGKGRGRGGKKDKTEEASLVPLPEGMQDTPSARAEKRKRKKEVNRRKKEAREGGREQTSP